MSTADPTPIFAALGDRTRLSLVLRLGDGRAASITALAADTRLTRQAVTKHLHVLEGAGLVAPAREGRETRYRLVPGGVAPARAWLDAVGQQWDAALGRLKALVEDQPSG